MHDDHALSQLITEIAAGGHQAFEVLYRATAPIIYRYLAARGIEESARWDVLQEVYLAVWRNARSFQGSAAAAWIFGIARHKLHDSFRRRQDEFLDDWDALAGSEDSDPGYQAARAGEILSALTPPDRELAHLVFVEDLGYADVAEILQIPVGTVKSRVFRLRKILQEQERKAYAER